MSLGMAAGERRAPGDLAALLARIGDHVAQYYTRARTLVCTENVRLQPLGPGLFPEGRARQLVYELRVAWEPPSDGNAPGEATVLRQLLTVDGRAPRANDKAACMDPKPVSAEPLALLLANRRDQYVFTRAGIGRVDGRGSVMLDYASIASGPADIVWRDECVTIDVPGRTRGRVWLDAATDDVLRLDERLTGMFEFPVPREHLRHGDPRSMIIERADSSIRYRAFTFHDPDETLMLPASIDSLTIIRNAGVPRLRTTQTFSNYRRFITDVRVVKEPDVR